MALRKKTKWRLAVLVGIFVLLIGAGGAAYMMRKAQIGRENQQNRAAGLDAFDREDYYTALHKLGTYINRSDEPEPEILYKYCQARQQVEEPGGKHLVDAAGMLRRLLEIEPGHMQARRDLLEIYLRLGYDTELLDTAEYILARDPGDERCIFAKAVALSRFRRFDEALPLARQYCQARPLDLDGQQTLFSILRQLERPASEPLALAQALHDAHPDAPQAQWLLAYAHAQAGERETAVDWARKTAGHEKLDADMAARTIGLLNSLGQFDEAGALLERAAGAHPDDRSLQRLWAQRLWQAGRIDQLVERLEGLNEADLTADADLLGMLAVALRERDADRTQAIADTLASRRAENLAAAWAIVLNEALLQDDRDEKAQLAGWQAALDRAPSHPAFNFWAGQAYAAAGQQERAMQCWQRAAAAAPAWPVPAIRMAQLLIAMDREAEALALAGQIARRHPRSLEAAVVLVQTLDASLSQSPQPQAEALLAVLAEVQKHFPDEPRTLAIQAKWLVRTGQGPAASEIIKRVLSAEEPASQSLLVQLAEISRQGGLGLEDECLRQSQKHHGLTLPVALSRAAKLASGGDVDGGLKLLEDARASSADADPQRWAVAVATYLETADDSRAVDAWRDASEKFADKASVQQAALEARSVWADKQLSGALIERLGEALGTESAAWRTFRGRWLLAHDPSDQALRDASELLRTAVTSAGATVETRLLLAECYDRLGNRTGAIEQLRAAGRMRPSRADIPLQIARVQLASGDTAGAAVTLAEVARHQGAGAEELSQASMMLASLGDQAGAIEAAERAAENSPDRKLLLAALLRQRGDQAKGDVDRVASLCDEMLEKPTVDVIAFAADFHASHGRQERAQAALDALDKLELQPGRREAILCQYQLQHGDPQRALELADEAVTKAPADPAVHMHRIAACLRAGQGQRMLAAIEEAAKRFPDNDDVAFVAANRHLAEAAVDSRPLRLLAMIMTGGGPDAQTASEALGALFDAREKQLTARQLADSLEPLAAKAPRLLALQMIFGEVQMSARDVDGALATALAAQRNFPRSPEPAQLATQALTAAGRFGEALSAARQWSQLAGDPPAAAVAVAELSMNARQLDQAQRALQPHLEAARAEPDQYLPVLVTLARIHLLQDRPDAAANLLGDLLDDGPQWRDAWLQLARQLGDADTAAQWMNQVQEAIPADAQAENIAAAEAWWTLGRRHDNTQWRQKALDLLSPLADGDEPLAQACQLRGVMHEAGGDMPAATRDYRRALDVDPKAHVAANNLAMVLVQTEGDLDQALELASKALELQPRSANYIDTLAEVHAANGRFDQASSLLARAMALQPGAIGFRINYAYALSRAGQLDQARQALAAIPADFDVQRLPTQLRDRLAAARKSASQSDAPAP
jgi:predicted Zn-dependent protease